MPAQSSAAEGGVSTGRLPAQQPAGHFGDSTPQRCIPGAMPDADLRSHSSPGSMSSAQADEASASGLCRLDIPGTLVHSVPATEVLAELSSGGLLRRIWEAKTH